MTSSKPGMTRIVAGESAVPKRKRAIEAALAIGLVLLIAVGAVGTSGAIRSASAAPVSLGMSVRRATAVTIARNFAAASRGKSVERSVGSRRSQTLF